MKVKDGFKKYKSGGHGKATLCRPSPMAHLTKCIE